MTRGSNRKMVVIVALALAIVSVLVPTAHALCQSESVGTSQGTSVGVCASPGITTSVGASVNVWSGEWEVVIFGAAFHRLDGTAEGGAVVCTSTTSPYGGDLNCPVNEAWPYGG
jgi:hypothetical protein